MAEERIFVGRSTELGAFDKVLSDPAGQAILVVGQQGMGKTMLVNRMADCALVHPTVKCGAVRYEVTRTMSPEAAMELMLKDAYAAANRKARVYDLTSQNIERWRSILGLLDLAKSGLGSIKDLAISFLRVEDRSTRDQLIERLRLISDRLPDDPSNGDGPLYRALFVIDSSKYMAPGSEDEWAIITRELPRKIKLLFAQRPDDTLVSSDTFKALGNVVRIPNRDLGLDVLGEDDVEELLLLRSGSGMPLIDELRVAVARYNGHPYAVPAVLDLIKGGMPIEDLPTDPPPECIAAAQWKLVQRRGAEAIKLYKAYALLEVPVPYDVVLKVAELAVDAHQHLMSDDYLRTLLDEHDGGRRIYHSIPADYIREQIRDVEAEPYHRRAIDEYRRRLKADVKPDALAGQRLALHVGEVEGPEAFVESVADECTPALVCLGLLDNAISLSQRALCIKELPEAARALVENNLGGICQKRGDLRTAEQLLQKSLKTCERLGNLYGIAIACGNLALVYMTRGETGAAEDSLRKALQIFEHLGHLEEMAVTCGNLGLTARARGEQDAAERFFRKALELFKRIDRPDGIATQCSNLGVIYEQRGDFARAEHLYQEALETSERLGYEEGIAYQCHNLGVICRERGDLSKAQAFCQRALDGFIRLGHLEGIAAAYGGLGIICDARADLIGAQDLHQKELDMCQRLGHLEGQAKAYTALGVVHQKRGQPQEAEQLWREALRISERLGQPEGTADACGNLGLLQRARGRLAEAEELLQKALEIEERLGHPDGIARQCGNLGLVCRDRGDLVKAQELFQRALQIQERLGRPREIAGQYVNLGLVCRARGDLGEAEEFYQNALKIFDGVGQLEGMATTYGNLGAVYLMRNDLDKADKAYRKALEISERVGQIEGMATAYGNLGAVCLMRNDLQKAEELFRKALEIFERLGALEGMANQYGNLGAICGRRGDFKGARELWTKARDLYAKIGMPHMVEKVQGWLDELPRDED